MNYIEKIIIFNCVPVCFFVWAQSSSLDIVNEANNIANPQCESPTIKSEQEKSTVTESNDNLSLEQSEKMKVLIGEYIREEFAKKQEEYDQKLLRFKEDFRREMEFKQKIDSAQNQPVFASELAQISKQPLPMMAQKSGLEIVSEINNDGTAKRFFTRESAVSLAKEKNQEIKAVKAEVISALSKRKEAGRQLFPHLFLEAGQTEGKLLENIEFEEKRYGLAVEHTLFHSGHLKNTYAQAKKQHEAARTRLSKIETDVAFTTTQNYYELVKALLNYKLQTVLAEEIQNDLTVTEEKFKQNLITEEEMLEVRTRYNQVNFQKLSAQRDTALARYKLMQTIGLTEKEAKTLDDVDTRIDFEGITVNLDNLQDEALTQRLDIKIAGLMV
jgi:outer membrane protein TolC